MEYNSGNLLSGTGKRYMEACEAIYEKYPVDHQDKTIPLGPVLKTLPHLIPEEGYVFEAVCAKLEGFGDFSTPYARREGLRPLKKRDIRYDCKEHRDVFPEGFFPIVEKLHPDGSDESLWELVLLRDLDRFLPLFWHAAHACFRYILDREEYIDISRLRECIHPETGQLLPDDELSGLVGVPRDTFYDDVSSIKKAWSLAGEDSLLPHISRNPDGTRMLRYCIWNDWKGLVRKSILCTGEGRKLDISELNQEVLVPFDCGLML